MFTGIVEQMGRVESIIPTDTGHRLTLTGDDLGAVPTGSSISVNGVCLTALEPNGESVSLDLVPETLARTSLGSLVEGSKVNIELAMPAGGRFDGHVVQGHVDGTAAVNQIETSARGVMMTIDLPPELSPYVVEKGSITVDGVSLTVATVGEETFAVALIPHTLEVTTLGLLNAGDLVNLETDVLAKYVERILKAQQ